MGKLIRAISKDGSVMACVVDTTDVVFTQERTHRTSAVVTAALGRLSTAAILMGVQMKGENDSLTLRINGGGPAGSLISVADSHGNVKAYAENAIVELELNQYGKLDVAGAVGKDGYLNVIRDIGLKEPYIGTTNIVSGEIAEDITNYYVTSEQIPTVCGLGVLVNPNLTVKSAGGFLIQLLPFADEKVIDVIEENIKDIPPVSSMFADGLTPEDIVNRLLKGLDPDILDETVAKYKCDCSRERVEKALVSLGKKDLQELIDTQDHTEVDCHFCNKKYRFNHDELRALIARK
ncbi:MAG: Hsp33 family molecular chaperone HslO [Oscillospiraceae bacterium]|nr:Hsp33 family molecular chaperone HslO [Oscillospiraceae bacterium]